MDLPIYELRLTGDDKTRVEAVALVDMPAIGLNYQAFNSNTKYDFKIADSEQRVVMGAAMIPDLPIYRRDERGEYYAIFRKDTINEIVKKFFKEQRNSEFNEMHDKALKTNGVFIYQSWITDSKMGVQAPKGFENVADGSWFIAAKVEDEDLWAKIKEQGVYKGFSVEGVFDVIPSKSPEEEAADEFIKIVKNYFDKNAR